jgi:hypothetical protein
MANVDQWAQMTFEIGTLNGETMNGHTNGHTNGAAQSSSVYTNKYTQIPGPLGLESASLKGKVALVTGAGMSTH